MTLLQTIDLNVGYRQKEHVKTLQSAINLEVNKGEIVCLMGQNGVGKTTLLKSISGMIPILNGEILIGKKNLQAHKPDQLARNLAIVLTERPFSQNMSVLELLTMGRHPYTNWLGFISKEDKEVIDQVINDTKINYLAEKKLGELSDGQFQKVMIARALVQQTPLILLDEPVAHLDMYNKLEVMTLLRKVARSDKGLLMTSHDISIATQFADRIVLFDFNKKPIIGIPEDLVLSGELEKGLYLGDFDFDIRDHTVAPQEPTGIAVRVNGDENCVYWTRRALLRNGNSIDEDAKTVISCNKNGSWQVLLNDETMNSESIEQILSKINSFKQPKS